MRIVLVRPPFVSLSDGPPIGLAYISKVYKDHGHAVKVIDLNLKLRGKIKYSRNFIISSKSPIYISAYNNLNIFCNEILEYKPDVIGFSLSYSTIDFGLKMASILSKEVRCIAGGPHASFNEHYLLDTGYFTSIVSSYGEEGAIDALTINGIINKRLKKEIEYLPDYTDIEVEKYGGRFPIVTTRGCPNNCTFCTQNHPYYYHSIESVINQLNNTPKIKKVMYNDSNINVNSNRTKELFYKISKNCPRRKSHVFGMEVKNCEPYIENMAKCGVNEIRIGIESGSIRERNSMNKPKFTNEDVINIINMTTRYKIKIWAQFIFCYPDQTENDRFQTLELMHKINKFNPQLVKICWFRFLVHYGTENLFKNKYNLIFKGARINWENEFYNPKKVTEIYSRYKKLVPANCKIYM